MSIYDSWGFSIKLVIDQAAAADWLWAIVSALLVFFVVGVIWGLAWNKKWGVFGHGMSAILSFLCALAVGFSVLTWRGADRAASWLEVQRARITKELTDSGTLNREILRDAWDQLEPLGGQAGLTPPVEGGNELRLAGEDDARILAREAASEATSKILDQTPFRFGAPGSTRDPGIVADEVVDAVSAPVYPIVVSPSNEWARAAVAAQVSAAIESADRLSRIPLADLKNALFWLIVILIGIQAILMPVAACGDIKEDPKV